MTAPTPEQMRALANDANWRSQKLDHADDRRAIRNYETALRAAADQLEAVQVRVRDYYYENGFTESSADHLIAFLTSDTAPQEADA